MCHCSKLIFFGEYKNKYAIRIINVTISVCVCVCVCVCERVRERKGERTAHASISKLKPTWSVRNTKEQTDMLLSRINILVP